MIHHLRDAPNKVSTLASWTSIAYTSWYGCSTYLGDPYAAAGAEGAGHITTGFGVFQGYECTRDVASPVTTFAFFHVYIVLTSWVIMSLFIGVISMGMFEAFQDMKTETKNARYRVRLEQVRRSARSGATARGCS